MAGVFSSLQGIVDNALQGIESPEVLKIIDAIGSIFGTVMLLWITFKSIDIAFGQRRFVISENLHVNTPNLIHNSRRKLSCLF
ncbi:hypothetical protein A9G43_00955 [Gilliamella sp. Occ3-1]|uniref:hypothetical protein n=1 Tax=Gilliamella sp. Occ3-1 TaxID=3120253 RepID=UPI00080D9251|nr:hypothetical protein [Gilliamella apicola]OCG69481.1 hypothetical protein A9G43_00955 [Gilliamella apicola]